MCRLIQKLFHVPLTSTGISFVLLVASNPAMASPSVVDSNLAVHEVVSGLVTPTSLAFLGDDDFLILEKNTGRVIRVNGGLTAVVLDLAVNFASERGLLGVALHPGFPDDPWVYLYWTESTTGSDTGVLSETPLLGNRVDRFEWDGSVLTFDQNIIRLRALQQDPTNGVDRGNSDGGVIRFGPDGKLFIFVGDVGRRGQTQNLTDGPFGAGMADDPFGGPEPDDAHLTGVILRLNDDGTTPADNPFYEVGAVTNGEAGSNLQKLYSFGHRNSFGMAFDPRSGGLWLAENGDDAFTEINRVEPGMNGGWVQIMGPVDRIEEFRAIETTLGGQDLQQVRWGPTNIADTPEEALARLFTVYEDTDEFVVPLLEGGQEVPPVQTAATGHAELLLNNDGTLGYSLSVGNIGNLTQAHIHLGGRSQNGPVVAFLFGPVVGGVDVAAEAVLADGVLTDADIIARPGFSATVAALVQRMREGRAYINVHTLANPSGEIRGQIAPNSQPLSVYSDPEFSWKFEVAPAGIGFLASRALGSQYHGNLFVGAARDVLEGGQIFRFRLTGNGRKIAVDDPRLEDHVADNLDKFDITESESLLFGIDFGIVTDIQTAPNGNLYVVSLSDGAIYEIRRVR